MTKKLFLLLALLCCVACEDYQKPTAGWADSLAHVWAMELGEPDAPILCAYSGSYHYASCSVNTSKGIYVLWCDADDAHHATCSQQSR